MRCRPSLLFVAVVAGGAACGSEEPGAFHTGVTYLDIRPTDGAGWQGNGYGDGVSVLQWDTPGERFRLHYTLQGKHAIPTADADGSGTPDFVEQFGKFFDQVYRVEVEKLGFRPPLDDSLYHDRPDFGGDGRFDVYLEDQGAGADGYNVVEACKSGAPVQCACYMVVENDFVNYPYPTPQDGMKVLSSHEFFHAVQAAYRKDMAKTFGEATAVWATEQVFPEEDDFESFLPTFFKNANRSLDDAGGPSDMFPYALALWPAFLAEKYDGKIIPSVMEELAKPASSNNDLDAIDRVLQRDYQSSLAAAFATFALWNYFTGGRPAPSGVGYKTAASMPKVSLTEVQGPLPQRVSGEIAYLSAQYFRLTIASGTRLKVTVERPQPLLAVHLITGGKEPKVVSIGPDKTSLSVESTGEVMIIAASTARKDRYLPLSLAVTEEQTMSTPPASPPDTSNPPPDQPPASGGGGCALLDRPPPAMALLYVVIAALVLTATMVPRARRASKTLRSSSLCSRNLAAHLVRRCLCGISRRRQAARRRVVW